MWSQVDYVWSFIGYRYASVYVRIPFFIPAVDTPNIGPKTVFITRSEAQFRASIANSVRFDGKNSSVHHRESL